MVRQPEVIDTAASRLVDASPVPAELRARETQPSPPSALAGPELRGREIRPGPPSALAGAEPAGPMRSTPSPSAAHVPQSDSPSAASGSVDTPDLQAIVEIIDQAEPAPDVAPDSGERARTLLDLLRDEITAESRAHRLALLLYAVGLVAWELLHAYSAARSAFEAASRIDPELEAARWALRAALREIEGPEAEVQQLEADLTTARRPGNLAHRLGHLALASGQPRSAALARWVDITDVDPPVALALALARYPHLLADGDPEAASETLEAALGIAASSDLSAVLLLERVRLIMAQPPMSDADGADPAPPRIDEVDLKASADRLYPLLLDLQAHAGCAPPVVAAIEPFVAQVGNFEMWLESLQERIKHARDASESGLEDPPPSTEGLVEIGTKAAWVLERLGRREEALGAYDEVLAVAPHDPCLLYRAADLAQRLGKYRQQRTYLERIAERLTDPVEAARALYQIGIIAQQHLSDDRLAARDFERAVEVLPRFTPALAALGRQSLRSGRTDDVRRRFETEIDRLETALERTDRSGSAPQRMRMIRGMVSRYYRVARLVERDGAIENALQYDTRALELAPDSLPSRLAMERIYESAGRWPALVELYLRLAERTQDDAEAVAVLLRAADILRVYVGDDEHAGRVYSRALARAPYNEHALQMAGEVFERIGNKAAQTEVDRRFAGTRPEDPVAQSRLVRAAESQEADGDPRMAAAEALPLFREALAAVPGDPAAFDGLLRTCMRLGRTAGLGQRTTDHIADGIKLPWVSLGQAAEMLVAAGHHEPAEPILTTCLDQLQALCRQEPRTQSASLRDRLRRPLLTLMALRHERARQWSALTDTLEALATSTENGPERAIWLSRQGEIWQHRLGDRRRAAELFARALEAHTECVAAQSGLTRLREPAWVPARQADPQNPAEPTQSDEALAEAFEAAPHDRKAFEAWMRRLRGPERVKARVAALWMRLPHEDKTGRGPLLASLTGLCETTGDVSGSTRAAVAWLAIDPESVPAVLALQRAAEKRGDQRARLQATERLASLVRSPARAAAYAYEAAAGRQADGASPRVVRRLLEKSLAADPRHDKAMAALYSFLRRERDWDGLVELLDRRIETTTKPSVLRGLYREQSRLLAEAIGDTQRALACVERALERFPDDIDATFEAAALAKRAGEHDRALALLDRLRSSPGLAVRTRAGVSRAAVLRANGDTEGCRTALHEMLTSAPELPDLRGACALLVDVLAARRNWKGVLRFLHQLNEMQTTNRSATMRTKAISAVFSEEIGDHPLAMRWFEQVIEPPPDRPTWRNRDDVDLLLSDANGPRPSADALELALAGVQVHLSQCPFDLDALRDMTRLYREMGDRERHFVVCGALYCLGSLEPQEQAWYETHLAAAHGSHGPQFSRPLTHEEYRRQLVDPHELSVVGDLWRRLAPGLNEVLGVPLPEGATAWDPGQSAAWRAMVRRIANGLRIVEPEGYVLDGQAGADAIVVATQPVSAVIVGRRRMEQPADTCTARSGFELARAIESLHFGRALLVSASTDLEVVSACVSQICARLSPKLAEAFPMGTQHPPSLLDRVEWKSAVVKLAGGLTGRDVADLEASVDAQASDGLGEHAIRRYAQAVVQTCDRAALLAGGDVTAAMECVGQPGVELGPLGICEAARLAPSQRVLLLRASARAVSLMTHWLSPDFVELRLALGMGMGMGSAA